MNCTGPKCDRPVYSKGLCSAHRQQFRKGLTLKPLSRKSLPFDERFWGKVDKSGDCWGWTSGTTKHGYGMFCFEGKMRGAHVVSWVIANGPVPEGKKVDHRCHNKPCVRPSHLRLQTHAGNGAYRKGAQVNNKLGIRNVRWNKQVNKFQVTVNKNGKSFYGGRYDSLVEAESAVRELRLKVHNMTDFDPTKRGEENGSVCN